MGTVPPLPVDLKNIDRVVVAGDWHGTVPKAVLTKAADLDIKVVLHVGDLGVGPWGGERKGVLHVLDRELERYDLVVLLTPGNHENWDRLEAAKRDDEGRWLLGRTGGVRGLPRGHRWEMGGLRFGSLGGATSVDANRRVEGKTWWRGERILEEHVSQLGDDPLDILITHEVPAGVPLVYGSMNVPPHLAAMADEGRDLIRQAVERTRPRALFAGHHHQRLTHDLMHAGGRSRVEVLSEEHTAGNAVVVDLLSDDLDAEPLQVAWRRERDLL